MDNTEKISEVEEDRVERVRSNAFSPEEPLDAPKPKKRGGGRKPIYTSAEERKQRNRDAQAAFRERRTEYIKELEETVSGYKKNLIDVQAAHGSIADECVMLRYKNSLLERILLEKGIDVRAELYQKTDPSLRSSSTLHVKPPPCRTKARKQTGKKTSGIHHSATDPTPPPSMSSYSNPSPRSQDLSPGSSPQTPLELPPLLISRTNTKADAKFAKSSKSKMLPASFQTTIELGHLYDAKSGSVLNQDQSHDLWLGHSEPMYIDEEAPATTDISHVGLDSSPGPAYQSEFPKAQMYKMDDIVPGFTSLSDLLNPGDIDLGQFAFSS